MKRLIIASRFIGVAASAAAQTNSVTVSLFQPQFSSESAIVEDDQLPISRRSRSGSHRIAARICLREISPHCEPSARAFPANPAWAIVYPFRAR